MNAAHQSRGLLVALAITCLVACGETGPDVRNNAIKVIQPYHAHGTWVFDDAATGLKAEPFVQGVPGMIDRLVADIPDARSGFRLTFSSTAFPGHELVVKRGAAHAGGYYYLDPQGRSGWLCPALFKYFHEAPEAIYVQADPVR